ncbi:MAG: histidine kinase [Bacteroidota bacterium]|nr:histidine kinase [Bacteroidota bacterium]
MNKYFLQGLFLFAFNSNAISQIGPEQNIDSLRRVLPSLKDTARIDKLNELSSFYIVNDQKDSAEHYATIGYQEAKKLNYIHGMAVYFCCKSQMARHFYDDFVESEALGKESLRWYEQTGNKEGMANTYYFLCAAAFAQSKFEEAIGYSEKRYLNAKQNRNQSEMMSALGYISGIYGQTGDYEKAFLYKQRTYDFFLKAKNKIEISSSLYGIAQLYELTGDYPNALIYFRRVLQMDDEETRKQRIASDEDIWFKMELAEVFSHLQQFDSAWHYYQSFKPSKDKTVYMRVYWISTGECYLLQKDYQHALQNFQLGLAEHKKLNDQNEIMRTLLDIGKTYLALNNNSEARQYGQEGLTLALQTKAKQFIRDGYQILSTVYDRLFQADSANFYFRQYITMKDSVLNDQIKGRFAAYGYEQKIASLNKEKLIGQQQLQIQQQQLKQRYLVTKMLIGGIAALLLLSIIIFRNIILKRKNEAHRRELAENELQIQKLESEKKQEEFQHKATELEMQALRAQMNPHFIFNCLTAINRFILKNESDSASDYLTKFSRLIRLVLNNSKKEFITLDDELEMLRLYLEMERMRFKYSFDYNINFKNEINPENIFIPPLLLQPFAENAIWHGLMNKEGQGHLTVLLSKENNILSCIIEDNGVGRAKAAELKSKSLERNKSLGLQITKERLALLNKDSNETAFFEMEDLYDNKGNANGTKVILKIRLLERFEERSSISKS